ncbi:hypothetical protein SFC66_11205 [Terribacillus saccharophilus]|uniref:hypothetical protein n=1 Tax=Terribacillus saccharophilus TaxID=361277 RepID=UPI003982D37D
MKHYLVIGGTGMLQAAVHAWNLEDNKVTVVARTKEKLQRLSASAVHPDRIQIIQADYQKPASFQAQLEKLPVPDVIVSWMHKSGNDAMQNMCSFYSELQKEISLFHIKGSSASDPWHNFTPAFGENIIYHEVILGFKVLQTGSRWLTNEEISSGVIHAVENRQPRLIVGSLEPWNSRPQTKH